MSEILFSAILNTDSYKHSHFLQYPPGATRVSSYIEARRGGAWPEAVFFGLQAYLDAYLSRRLRLTEIESAQALAASPSTTRAGGCCSNGTTAACRWRSAPRPKA